MKKLYARFWLWKNGYCKHGNKYKYEPPGFRFLVCLPCAEQSTNRHALEDQKREQKKQRMLSVL